jgi:hypothetical protein
MCCDLRTLVVTETDNSALTVIEIDPTTIAGDGAIDHNTLVDDKSEPSTVTDYPAGCQHCDGLYSRIPAL